MSGDARLLLDVWEAIRDELPTQKRETVAMAVLKAFAENGFDARDLAEAKDEDEDIEAVFDEVFSETEDEEEY